MRDDPGPVKVNSPDEAAFGVTHWRIRRGERTHQTLLQRQRRAGCAPGWCPPIPTIPRMPGDRSAPARFLPAWLLVLGLACGALIALWGLGNGQLSGMLLALALALLLLLLGAACAWAGWLAAQQRLSQALREARAQNRLLAQWGGHWMWQTDRSHRLVRLRPPQGAPATAWSPGAFAGQVLWERFQAPALQQLMHDQQAFDELPSAGADQQPWTLRAQPCWDALGRFAGYVGTACPQPASAATSAPDPAGADEQAAFAYTLSHDLRAPIRVVEGFARILQEDHGAALDRRGHDHLDRVLAAAARMNSMIDALLSMSQLSARPLARQAVDLSLVARWVMDELMRETPERTAQIDIEPALTVQGDPTLLRMVLENLLGNAWKYSVRAATAQIALRRELRDGRVVYVVADNGAGFDMRFVDRLFGLFQRLHSASDYPGTGVGLASVRRIVRRHGGQVWAESAVGEGARFYFTLA